MSEKRMHTQPEASSILLGVLALLLCMLVLMSPLAAMDYALHPGDFPLAMEQPLGEQHPHTPACRHDSHHGVMAALLVATPSERGSAEAQAGLSSNLLAAGIVGSAPQPAVRLVGMNRESGSVYLLTHRLRL